MLVIKYRSVMIKYLLEPQCPKKHNLYKKRIPLSNPNLTTHLPKNKSNKDAQSVKSACSQVKAS